MYFKPILISTIISFIIYFIIHRIVKNKKPVNRAFISVISGPCTLIIVNVLGGFFGVGIPVSVLSTVISITLGTPGVLCILILKLFF